MSLGPLLVAGLAKYRSTAGKPACRMGALPRNPQHDPDQLTARQEYNLELQTALHAPLREGI